MRFQKQKKYAIDRPLLEAEFKQSRDLGGLCLGERCLYFPKLTGISYLPYEGVQRAYLRQEEVKATVCCGQTNFDQFFIMVQGDDGGLYRGGVLSKDMGKKALEHIAKVNPKAQIGYQPQQ